MLEDDQSYYQRRAATQKMLGERSDDPAVAGAHAELARLHTERARDVAKQARGNVLSLFG